jgi:hypothetical protein
VTTRILLNKWQCQLEKERYQKRKYEEERRRAEEEARRRDLEQYTREQERAHWGCAFFRHCWNEGVGDRPRGPLKQGGNPHLNPRIEMS